MGDSVYGLGEALQEVIAAEKRAQEVSWLFMAAGFANVLFLP